MKRICLLVAAVLAAGMPGIAFSQSGAPLTPFLLFQQTDDGTDVCTNPPLPEGTYFDRTIFVSHERVAQFLEIYRPGLTSVVRSGTLSRDDVRQLKDRALAAGVFRATDCYLPETDFCVTRRGQFHMVWYSTTGLINEFDVHFVPDPSPVESCSASLKDVLASLLEIRDLLAPGEAGEGGSD